MVFEHCPRRCRGRPGERNRGARIEQPPFICQGRRRRLVGTYRNAAVEIRLVDRASFGSALFEATGNREHVGSVGRRGLAATPYASEEALYSSVGLSYIEPELRQATGEVEAAAAGQLPALVRHRTCAAICTCTRPTAMAGIRST